MPRRTIQSDFETIATTVEEAPQFPFSWRGGVILPLTPEEIKVVAGVKHKKVCVLCGQKRPLAYERVSGGLKSHICGECAVKYVLGATRVSKMYSAEKQRKMIKIHSDDSIKLKP